VKLVVVGGLTLFCLTGVPTASAAPECCAVTNAAKNGLVTAKETATGRAFQFQVKDAVLLRSLKVGQKISADLKAMTVTLPAVQRGAKPVQVKILKADPVGTQARPLSGATASAATSGSGSSKKKKTSGGLDSLDPNSVKVTPSPEGTTATAIRGRPETPTSPAKQPAPGTTSAAALGSQTQAINPDVIALKTTSDLAAKDLGFTALGEITFNLVNRGEVGINVPKKQGGATTMAAQPPASGPPIKIDIYMGGNLVKSVFQPSVGGKQTKNFKENIPTTLPKPKCLETRNLKVVVDPQNQIKELHDDNNVTEATNSARPCPDLAIKSIKRDYSGVLKETYSPKVTIVNQGNAPSPSTQVWATSLPGDPWPVNGWPAIVPVKTISALAPGATTSFHVGGSVLSSNRTAVRIVLDRHYQIEESDENNNFKDERL
jgi:hypothetical protein